MRRAARVTGASDGIGAATAVTLTRAGWDVAVHCRANRAGTERVAAAVGAEGGQPGRADRIAPMVPMRRAGRPEEIAEAIAWLVSDNASYITGSFLDISGGR